MAKVVDVTDVDDIPGAGMLHFDDGKPPLIALPEIADDYRARLGIPDNRVAGPGGGEDTMAAQRKAADADAQDMKDTLGGAARAIGSFFTTPQGKFVGAGAHAAPPPPAAPAYAPPAPAPVSRASPPPQASPSDGVPPMLARPPEPSPQAAPAEPGPDATPPAADDLMAQAREAQRYKDADALLHGKPVPASSGSPGGYRPTTAEKTVEAGAPYDPALAGMRMDADRQVLDAQLAQAREQRAAADAQAAKAAAAVPVYRQQQATAQDELNRKQASYEAQRQRLEDDLQQYTESARPDPDRYFKSRSTFANIMGTIGQALGAAGATLGHTQNWAFEATQNQIRNDIQLQVAEYQAGRAERGSAIARMADYYHGDMDMAKNALAIAMNKVVQTEAQQFAAQSQSQQVASAANVFSAQFQKDSLAREQQLYTASIGKTTTKESEKYHDPVAANLTGRKELTDKERDAILKRNKGVPDQGALGLTAQGEARQKALYSTKIEPLAPFADSLSHRATLMGIHFDPKTGELTNSKGKPAQESDLNIPVGAGVVGKHVSGDVLTPKAMELRRAEENSVRLHAAAVYNHSISAEEGSAEVDHTVGSTDAAKLANLRYLAEEYRKRKLAVDTGAATIDPRIVNERDAAERAVNYARATGTPLAPPGARPGGAPPDSGAEPEAGDGTE